MLIFNPDCLIGNLSRLFSCLVTKAMVIFCTRGQKRPESSLKVEQENRLQTCMPESGIQNIIASVLTTRYTRWTYN